jgi:hypothetical protein
VRNLNTDEFFRLVSGSNGTLRSAAKNESGVWAYFSREISDLGAPVAQRLLADLTPPFGQPPPPPPPPGQGTPSPDHHRPHDEQGELLGRPSLWVGSQGTVAHLHWDARPNLFVQVYEYVGPWCRLGPPPVLSGV